VGSHRQPRVSPLLPHRRRKGARRQDDGAARPTARGRRASRAVRSRRPVGRETARDARSKDACQWGSRTGNDRRRGRHDRRRHPDLVRLALPRLQRRRLAVSGERPLHRVPGQHLVRDARDRVDHARSPVRQLPRDRRAPGARRRPCPHDRRRRRRQPRERRAPVPRSGDGRSVERELRGKRDRRRGVLHDLPRRDRRERSAQDGPPLDARLLPAPVPRRRGHRLHREEPEHLRRDGDERGQLRPRRHRA
jgi:hypothetical protein